MSKGVAVGGARSKHSGRGSTMIRSGVPVLPGRGQSEVEEAARA